MEALTTHPRLCNWESNRSKFISMFIKLCLQSICNLASVGPLVEEKFNDCSLIMVYWKCILNGFSSTKWDNNSVFSPILETDLIYVTSRRVPIVEISIREMRSPEFGAGGWGICWSTRRYDWNALLIDNRGCALRELYKSSLDNTGCKKSICAKKLLARTRPNDQSWSVWRY
jgi:hypothetical protein